MTLIQRNDVNQIFAEQAPTNDQPAIFGNYPRGWDESRKNDGKPKIPQFNYLQQRTDQNFLYIHQQGAALPFDESIEYAEGAVVIKDGDLQQLKNKIWQKINNTDSYLNITSSNFGAKPTNTAQQNDIAIQKAIDQASSQEGGVVWIPEGAFDFYNITPKSNVTIDGVGTLRQIQPKTDIYTGINKPEGVSLLSFYIKNIGLDGNRKENPSAPYNPIINIVVGVDDTVSDIQVLNTKQKNAQEHFIRVVASDINSKSSTFKFKNNSFITTSDKWNLSSASVVSLDAVRFEQIPNAYSVVNFTDIEITNNTAKNIRTLADLKRGCGGWVVDGNTTRDMYDCHHSTDGSFNGVFSNNIGSNNAGDYPSTFTNFIEIQGENIAAHDNIFDGGGRTVNGIFITDYGRPSENGKGYQSVNVNVHDNTVRNITTNAFKAVNPSSCKIKDNHGENIGAHIAVIDSGTGRTDGSKPLQASGNYVGGNTSRNAALGVKIGGLKNTKGLNLDNNGADMYYYSESDLSAEATTFRNSHTVDTLNLNRDLNFTGTQANNLDFFDSDFYPAVTKATTIPSGESNAVTVEDESTTSVRVAYLKERFIASRSETIYFRVKIKKNTAQSCSIVVQEYSDTKFISNTFCGYFPTNDWVTVVGKHTISSEDTTNLRIGLCPASSFNTGEPVGKTDFSGFEIFRYCPSIK